MYGVRIRVKEFRDWVLGRNCRVYGDRLAVAEFRVLGFPGTDFCSSLERGEEVLGLF